LLKTPRGGETHMEKGMSNMMEPSSISWIFTIIVLFICILLVIHIVFTLWRQRNQLHQLIEQHSRLVHSLPMSLGMISTMTICTTVGAIMNAYISASYIVGLIIGILVSGIISFPFKDEIAVLDGIVAGVMGGLMGVMIVFMIPKLGLYTVSILLTVLFAFTWGIMCRHIKTFSSKQTLNK
jgi:hypothetical protein